MVDLERILWVRAEQWREALRCTERLLETAGIPLVLMDLGHHMSPRGAEREAPPRIPVSAWTRLARLTVSTRTALICLGGERLAGPQAEVVLEMQPPRAGWSAPPALFEGIGSRAVLVRHRGGPVEGTAEQCVVLRGGEVPAGEHVRLCVVDGNARFDLLRDSIIPVAPGHRD